jgi:hypothetical protein
MSDNSSQTNDSPIDDRTTVLALLQMNGLTPSAEEVETMIAGYPMARQMVAGLYSMPGVRYEEPAVTFDPRVTP